ncbi:MAG: ATP-binding protein [Clostridia bacterium]
MRQKIFRGALILTLVAALLVGVMAAVQGYRMMEAQLEEQLWQELDMLDSLRAEQTDAFLQTLKGLSIPNRVTLVARDGTVRYDNQNKSETMPNHKDREEIVQARESGKGFARRYSDTLLEEQIYCVKRLADGGFLRISATQKSVGGYLARMIWVLALGTAAVLVLAAIGSRAWTKTLVRPINEIDLENPLSNRVYDELSPMLRRMAEQNRKLEMQMKEIRDRRNELDTIIGHMNEGLLILDEHRHVLLMNDCARAILRTQRPVEGHTALPVYNRSQTLLETVDKAQKGASARAEMSADGRDYLLTASVVRHREGIVLLIQDVTEHSASERARKRFTANVSHELRTPLTTISGYAELLQNGLAQAHDVPVFARKIYDESRRLLKLIEDILHLSQLDEGFAAGRLERIELLAAARAALVAEEELAQGANVRLRAEGEPVETMGDATLLDEMLRNLIENGVKYNRPNGEVCVRVTREGDKARVSVRDTGIGIPQEHQSKVFERFYRVDGSRSKRTGGTGLGLSIVKHGAEYHRARLALESEVGAGTCVTLWFQECGSTRST